MNIISIAIIAGGMLLFSMISGRLRGTVITAPLVFIVFGYVIGNGGTGIASVDMNHAVIHAIAELTLILVLFTDAVRINLTRLRKDHSLPLRMLLFGLPLVILLGALAASWIFPQFSLWEAALLACLLAPTDAALGQSVVSAKIVPVRIRQAINVESGLNDGIALPAVLLFGALASAQQEVSGAAEWLRFGLLQITLGPVTGIAMGYVGARLLDSAVDKGWVDSSFQGIGVLSLALLIYLTAELIGGNGFIAAFVGGMVFGNTIRHPCTFLLEFMETEGQLFMLITFLIFGAFLLPEGIHYLTPEILLYAVLSLTVIRMLPIAISLMGSGIKLPTYLFLGWFGPRGLASILFALFILEESDLLHHTELLSVTVITVALSALLHGLTAAPLSDLYGRLTMQMGKCEENEPVAELPIRVGLGQTLTADQE